MLKKKQQNQIIHHQASVIQYTGSEKLGLSLYFSSCSIQAGFHLISSVISPLQSIQDAAVAANLVHDLQKFQNMIPLLRNFTLVFCRKIQVQISPQFSHRFGICTKLFIFRTSFLLSQTGLQQQCALYAFLCMQSKILASPWWTIPNDYT